MASLPAYLAPMGDMLLDGFPVKRRRSGMRKRPGDAWAEAAKALASDPEIPEHEVAAALFDLANMFAEAEPVLQAEDEAAHSPQYRSSYDAGPKAKRARPTKPKGAAAGKQSGRGGAAGPSFQDALARPAQRDSDFAAQLAARQAGAGHLPDGWDTRSAAVIAAAANKGGALHGSVNGAFAAADVPAGLAGFYPPNGLPLAANGTHGSWGGPTHSEDRGVNSAGLPGFARGGPEARFPRCASHVYIAHFIEYQSKLERQRQAAGVPSSSAGFDRMFPADGQQGLLNGQRHANGQQQQMEERGEQRGIKQEPMAQNSSGSVLPSLSGGLPFGAGLPLGGAGSRGPSGAPQMPNAHSLAAQQQQYAQQLNQLAMLSQQSGAGFPPFLPPAALPGGGGPHPPQGLPTSGFSNGSGSGMTPQQAAVAGPFFNQQPGFNLASLLPPNTLPSLATSAGMQQDFKGHDGKRSPSSAGRNHDFGGQAEVEAWAAKLAANSGVTLPQHANSNYQLAEAQLKQFQEAFANAERERKLRCAGVLDGRSMPMHVDAAALAAAAGNRMLMH